MSLYHKAKTKVRVESEFSEEFLEQVGVRYMKKLCLMFTQLLFAIAVDLIMENLREGLMNEIFHADSLILLSKRIDNLRDRFLKKKKVFESKGLKVSLQKIKSDGKWFE